jgi:hypothetical protein
MPGTLQTDRLYDETIGTIRTLADQIGAMPRNERAEAFENARWHYCEAFAKFGRNEEFASRWVEVTMSALRLLVAQVDADSGPKDD